MAEESTPERQRLLAAGLSATKPTGTSPAIPLGGTQLRAMMDKGQVQTQRMLAGHDWADRALQVSEMTEEQANSARKLHAGSQSKPVSSKPLTIYARGTDWYYEKEAVRVTIIRCNVGLSKKQKPIHLVVDRSGNEWRAIETHLRQL